MKETSSCGLSGVVSGEALAVLILAVECADVCGRPRIGEQRDGSLSLFLYWLGKVMPTAFRTWLAIKTKQISPKSSAPNAPATVKIQHACC